MAGRPNKLTPAVQARIIDVLRQGGTISTACGQAKIHRDTLHAWLKRGRSQRAGRFRRFLQAVEEAKASAGLRALRTVRLSILGGWFQAPVYDGDGDPVPLIDAMTGKQQRDERGRPMFMMRWQYQKPEPHVALRYLERVDADFGGGPRGAAAKRRKADVIEVLPEQQGKFELSAETVVRAVALLLERGVKVPGFTITKSVPAASSASNDQVAKEPSTHGAEEGRAARAAERAYKRLGDELVRLNPGLAQLRRLCPHTPWPKQLAFLLAPHEEVFFGGAAGPGKSDALIMGALEFTHVPGYRALILRRTFPQLEEIMDRARQWLLGKRGVNWVGSKRQFEFECPTGGTAVVRFGYCDAEMDVANYDGFEYQYIGWDELTHFTEWQYTYLFSRLRTVICPACEEKKRVGHTKLRHHPLGHVPVRMRSASNPGNRGHDWVKTRFHVGEPPEVLEKQAPIRWDDGIPHGGRIFIPAVMSDNPSLRREDYEARLMNLSAVRREQLLAGNWDVRAAGELFDRSDFDFLDDWPRDVVIVRAWDLAASAPSEDNKDPDWTVGVKMAMNRKGEFFVIDVVRVRETPAVVEEIIRATAEMDGRTVSILVPQDPGAAGKGYAQHLQMNVLRGFSVYIEPQTGSKYVRAKPMSAASTARNVKLLRAAWNKDFIEELEQAGPNEKLYAHDDQWDAASFAFNWLCANPMEFGWQSGRLPSPKDQDPRFEDKPQRGPGQMLKSRRWKPGLW